MAVYLADFGIALKENEFGQGAQYNPLLIHFSSIFFQVLPGDWTSQANSVSTGRMRVSLSGTTPLAAGPQIITRLLVDSYIYDLVTGTVDTDNARFRIVDDKVFIKQGETLDFEAEPSYSVLIRTTDSGGLSCSSQGSRILLGLRTLMT